ncbi:GNAT family N-acetyltransferase [Rhodoplanes sp. Z2-YC6860]|uniref:GNAT family N-acetyltransferase n=1 Tax=Rhodoplanes sp. Z2-YC6860 TaxID=674703 RepID=UPI00078CAE9F|nr:GNAT family N-acetyltransferase [Rhodoplanes sp. Z2-YC6860]AMN43856.1 GCN5-related N-acetyltransferase [Rhodoplanes sp. Z2-YC6860]
MNPPTLPTGLSLGPMRREEADILEGWAAGEGWNPGNADIGIAWATDPDAFIALRQGSELAGGGTIFSYDGRFGFMGLFIVRRELRGAGLGSKLWHHRLTRLKERLLPGAPIGMDGVFAMVPFYERGGFALAYRDLRFEGIARGAADPQARSLDPSMFSQVEAIDRNYVPAPRAAFLRQWMFQPGAHAIGLIENDRLIGYGVARPARVGYKLGPVFAERPDVAERVIGSLMARMAGEQVQLDVPEPNQTGMRLAQQFGLKEVFGCARMYCGADPKLPVQGIYGVTSFEFG